MNSEQWDAEDFTKPAYITVKLLRHFGFGIMFLSPSFNGFPCFHIDVGCIQIQFWVKGEKLIEFNNYWNG